MSYQTDQSGGSVANDTPQEIDFNPGLIFEKLDAWLDGFIKLLPNIGIAILLIVAFWFIAKGIRSLIEKSTRKNDRDNLGRVLGGFVKWVVFALGVMLALTVVIPSLKPGDLIAGLGVSSVAIGFAFKDILQNWLAGLLILLRQPFEIGDQIVVNGFEGTVERIETRATIIKQYNNQRVVIPNSDIYTNAVKVKTANDLIRSQYDVGIGYGDNIQDAVKVIREALSEIDGINKDKNIDVLPWDLAASWVTIRMRWWTDSQRSNVVKIHAQVIEKVKDALDEARIDMPYDTKVQLLHDQTEATDGDRSAQREGWPMVNDGDNPEPLWKKKQEAETKKHDRENSIEEAQSN